jgi:hypothetical protein
MNYIIVPTTSEITLKTEFLGWLRRIKWTIPSGKSTAAISNNVEMLGQP